MPTFSNLKWAYIIFNVCTIQTMITRIRIRRNVSFNHRSLTKSHTSLTSCLSFGHRSRLQSDERIGVRCCYAGDTRSRNFYQKLAWKKLTQVHHSFLHQNNYPANHVARFVLRAGEFLSWNRAVLNCVQETCTRKILVPDWPTNVQVCCTRRLAQVSGTSYLFLQGVSPGFALYNHCRLTSATITNYQKHCKLNLAAVVGRRVRRCGVTSRWRAHAAGRADPVRRVAGDSCGRRRPLSETPAEVGRQVAEAGRMLPEATGRAWDGSEDYTWRWRRRLLDAMREMRWRIAAGSFDMMMMIVVVIV